MPDLLQTWVAEDIALVDDLKHRGFVPDGCLEEVGQGGSACHVRLDSLPRRPRLISSASNSDDALSFTNMSVIMHMWCNKSRSTFGSSSPVTVRGFPNL